MFVTNMKCTVIRIPVTKVAIIRKLKCYKIKNKINMAINM